RCMREALEAFWRDLRKFCKRALERWNFSAEEVRATLEVISSNLTKEYIDSVQAEEQQILRSIQDASAPATIQVQKEWFSDKTAQSLQPLPKAKIKTRPAEPSRGVEEIDGALAGRRPDCGLEGPPKVFVTKRAYDMLTLMFPVTAEESVKGIQWDMF